MVVPKALKNLIQNDGILSFLRRLRSRHYSSFGDPETRHAADMYKVDAAASNSCTYSKSHSSTATRLSSSIVQGRPFTTFSRRSSRRLPIQSLRGTCRKSRLFDFHVKVCMQERWPDLWSTRTCARFVHASATARLVFSVAQHT